MSRFGFEIAKESDDIALQQIIQNNPMDGEIQLAFQRSPSYFDAIKVEGNFNQVVIGREESTGKIIGFGTRSVKPMYVSGKVCNVGYLSNLRLDKEYRGGTLVARGYRYFKELHKDGRAIIYLTTIAEENEYTKRILTAGRAGLPRYQDIGLYYSIVVPILRKKKKICNEIKVVKGSEGYIEEIFDCIHQNGATKQFYPYYTKEDINSNNGLLKGLNPSDFYIALDGNKIVGVIARWDQRKFRQNIVIGYKGKMRALKPIYNLYAKFTGFTRLPNPNSQLNCFYVSLIAIDSNQPRIFRILVRELYNDSIGKDYHYFILGLHSRDSLLEVLKEYMHFTYKTRVYIVYWEGGESFCKTLDQRIPYLEVGTL